MISGVEGASLEVGRSMPGSPATDDTTLAHRKPTHKGYRQKDSLDALPHRECYRRIRADDWGGVTESDRWRRWRIGSAWAPGARYWRRWEIATYRRDDKRRIAFSVRVCSHRVIRETVRNAHEATLEVLARSLRRPSLGRGSPRATTMNKASASRWPSYSSAEVDCRSLLGYHQQPRRTGA